MNKPILKLDENTVNRIAAGEVVQRPSAAIKEMIENSLDAGSTAITVMIKGGGLQLMQIQDNGHGIRKEDLGIVCERFTTSKLREFDDLKKIDTFGFRGEALASITHVAHVTITTKTANSQCAYKAKYSDGHLVPLKSGGKAEPQPCAGMVGTTITVEDLFYNMNTRKLAFKNTNEQYQRVMDVVGKYSIHYGDQKVAFTCKKQGQNVADVHTPQNSSTKDNIKLVYGSAVFKELIQFGFSMTAPGAEAGDSCADGGVQEGPTLEVKGYVTNANYSSKKGVCILFINHRLVECSAIKRVAESVYADLLPRHTHPFLYLDIAMPPAHVDVNVHPTKKEVHFLNEAELLERLHAELAETLKSANQSRTFYTQSQLPASFTPQDDLGQEGSGEGGDGTVETDENTANGDSPDEARAEGEGEGESSRRGTGGSSSSGSSGSNTAKRASDGGHSGGESESRGAKRKGATGSSTGSAPSKMVRVDPLLRKIDTMLPRLDTSSSSSSSSGADATKAGTQVGRGSDRTVHDNGDDNDDYGSIPLLLCGECGTENAPSKPLGVRGIQGSDTLEPGPEVAPLGSCECCGSDQLTVRVPENGKDASGKSKTPAPGAPVAGGRGRSWDPKMAEFEETRVGYDSIQTLLSRIRRGKGDKEDTARSFSFVGVLDDRYTAVQLHTKLLLLDHVEVCRHLFYQLCIRRFSCAPRIALSRPVPVRDFIRAALDLPEAQWDPKRDRSKSDIASAATATLVDNAEMLSEYFAIDISLPPGERGGSIDRQVRGGEEDSHRPSAPAPAADDAELRSLPELLSGYVPLTTALPMFLLRLATDSRWDSELDCFDSVAWVVASLYGTLTRPEAKADGADDSTSSGYVPGARPDPSLAALMEATLFPAIKALLLSPKDMFSGDTVVQVASLEQLYRVFERC